MSDEVSEQLYVNCRCTQLDHLLRFSLEQFDGKVLLTATVHLAPLGFWERVRNAFWYVLGRRSTYGDFQEVLFDEEGVKGVIDLFQRYRQLEILKDGDAA